MKLEKSNKKIVVITGISGAGRSSALKIFEDLGYEAIDNLPFFFINNILEAKIKKNLAVGIDIRSRDFDAEKISSVIQEKQNKINLSVIFFDCDTSILINRYKESRRIHPLKLDLPMKDIIKREKSWVEPLKRLSEYYINTSNLSINLLRKKLEVLFGNEQNKLTTCRLITFGYKNGLPREADFVFDMRFLKNPFYVKKLKKLNGKNQEIIDFVTNQKQFRFFFDTIKELFDNILIGFKDESKNYITIAFGCTGGIHRSVVSGDLFFNFLKDNKKIEVFIDHRDLGK